MSKPVAPSFQEWVAQTFGLPKGASSPQNKVSEAEAVKSFLTWFTAIISTWDGDVISETDKRKSSDTDDFRRQARYRLEHLNFKLKERKQLQEIRKEAPHMDRIFNFLKGAEDDIKSFNSTGNAESWREWVEFTMYDWASQASRFNDLAEKGPMADGVVKGMKEIRESDDHMREREIESAKMEEREPVFANGFLNNRTHVQQVNKCLG